MQIPSDKHDQEDLVVRALCGRLAGQGREPLLIERPDRVQGAPLFPGLTTDAVLGLDGDSSRERWSVDVMALAAPQSHFQVPDALISHLSKIAEQRGVMLSVAGESPDVRDVRVIAKFVDAALRVAGRPAVGEVAVAGLVVAWSPPTAEEVPAAHLLALLLESPSAKLSDQIAATIRNPLRSKATRQARPARALGLKTAVALDRTGHAGIAQGMHWLPQFPSTIATAVVDVLDPVEHDLDAVLLLDRDGDWHLVFGAFPGFADGSTGA